MATALEKALQIENPVDRDQYWFDWHWQMRHSVRRIDDIERLLNIRFSGSKRDQLERTIATFPMSVTPYYLSLIDRDNFENDPVFQQSVPNVRELQIMTYEHADPLHEDKDSPVEGVTHRYPDRVLLCVSNMCSMYCRHCTRKRKVGDRDFIPDRTVIAGGIDYIRRTPQIRDVLLSGGDPLMLEDEHLEWILREIRSIEHVEIVRIGTRMPVVLPFRITENLVRMLKKYHPLWINTHFNHPCELTRSARTALRMLADAGIPLGNQSVLLAGVNDCPRIIRKLCHKLVQNRVRPYYLYQCDLSEGLAHFRTPVGKGIEIMESLVGHTSGLARPVYVIDAPGGAGKIPVMPNYIISWSTNKVVLRNYEGMISTYNEPESYDSVFCDRNCDSCNLQLRMDDADENPPVGITRLMSDFDETITLIPSENHRMKNRENGSNSGMLR